MGCVPSSRPADGQLSSRVQPLNRIHFAPVQRNAGVAESDLNLFHPMPRLGDQFAHPFLNRL